MGCPLGNFDIFKSTGKGLKKCVSPTVMDPDSWWLVSLGVPIPPSIARASEVSWIAALKIWGHCICMADGCNFQHIVPSTQHPWESCTGAILGWSPKDGHKLMSPKRTMDSPKCYYIFLCTQTGLAFGSADLARMVNNIYILFQVGSSKTTVFVCWFATMKSFSRFELSKTPVFWCCGFVQNLSLLESLIYVTCWCFCSNNKTSLPEMNWPTQKVIHLVHAWSCMHDVLCIRNQIETIETSRTQDNDGI